MSPISYILTYRDDGSAERRANLAAVLNWASALADVHVLVIEQAAKPSPALHLPSKVQWVFCPNAGPFNKSWGSNVGARLSDSPVLAFGDADVLCAEGWLEAVNLLRLRGLPIVKPYRRIVDLTPQESVRVRAGEWGFLPPRPANALQNREAQGEYVVFAGGLFLLKREVFDLVSGFDERFLGWGGEDDAMTIRLKASGLPMEEVDLAPALHLWHPRSSITTFDQPFYEANCAILSEYHGCTKAQMKRLWAAQREGMGRAGRYSA